jgi:hypothetical protein
MYSPTDGNKDIKLVGSGVIYTKLNVPISPDPIIFTEQDRHPVLTMRNNTGFPIRIITPVEYSRTQSYSSQREIQSGANVSWLLPELDQDRNITVTYSVFGDDTLKKDYKLTEKVELNADVTLSLTKRPPVVPVVTIANNTGYQINVSKPFSRSMPNGETFRYPIQSEAANPFTVTYGIRNFEYTEQVTLNNNDVTLTLTKRPPVVTIANNTGNTVNIIFIRNPGDGWTGQNLLTQATQTGERRGSITNRETFTFWLGDINIKPDRYDIRIDDVQGNSYVKSNVQITGDMTLTFTQSDKR